MINRFLLADSADVSSNLFPICTGGTITTDGDFKIHTFTDSSIFTIGAGGNCDCSALVLGRGGNGGGTNGNTGAGGGGAAGIIRFLNGSLSPGTYDISFGSWPGGTVSFYNISSTGGGNGEDAHGGGSGAGGNNADYSGGGPYVSGGGGAGSGGNGGQPVGGNGTYSTINGTNTEYGKGGNGGTYSGGWYTSGSAGPDGKVIIRYKYKV